MATTTLRCHGTYLETCPETVTASSRDEARQAAVTMGWSLHDDLGAGLALCPEHEESGLALPDDD